MSEITKVLDTVTPEVFAAYMEQYSTENNAFIQSGVAVVDARVSENITAGGTLVTMPFWNDLGGEDEGLGDGDKALSTDKITAGADIAAVMYRGKAWSVNELAAVFSGADPLQSVMNKIGGYWTRREERVLLSVLDGLFEPAATDASTPAGALVDSHLADNGKTKIDAGMVLDAKQLLGDAAEKLSLIAMHSATYTALQKQNLIAFIQPAGTNVQIPTYLGYRVIKDDTIPVGGTTANPIYRTYLLGTGAFGSNSGQPSKLTTFETARVANKGNDEIYTRRAFTMHPYGVKFTNSVITTGELTPLNADLANPKNWSKVYDDKNIGIVAINHTI